MLNKIVSLVIVKLKRCRDFFVKCVFFLYMCRYFFVKGVFFLAKKEKNYYFFNFLKILYNLICLIHLVFYIYMHYICIIGFFFYSLYHFISVFLLCNTIVFVSLNLFVGFSSYLLVSGFIYFIKLYDFSRYTSLIQDFWRISLNLLWLIEGFLILIILYLVLINPIRPVTMTRMWLKRGFEYSSTYISFEGFIIKHIPLLVMVFVLDVSGGYLSFIGVIGCFFISIFFVIDEYFVLLSISSVFKKEFFIEEYSYNYICDFEIWEAEINQEIDDCFWRNKFWVTYFGFITFLKFIHILICCFCFFFVYCQYLSSYNFYVSTDNYMWGLNSLCEENLKAAINFNLIYFYTYFVLLFLKVVSGFKLFGFAYKYSGMELITFFYSILIDFLNISF